MMGKLTLTRRSFSKLAMATAAAAAVSLPNASSAFAEGEGASTQAEVKHIRSSCRGCGKMECGVWVTVQDGKVVKIEGDESCPSNRGHSCSKSQASMQAAYHPDRLTYPMKRTNPKGEDPGWVRISWDEAMSTCAEKFQELMDKYGGNRSCASEGHRAYGAWALTAI